MNLIVISLARASERREKIKSQLSERNIEGIIMDAVDGNDLPESEKNRIIQNPIGWRNGEHFKPGEIGCLKSHINAIKMAKTMGWEHVIILEDDVILSEDFEKGIKLIFKLAEPNWEHILLGAHIYLNAPPVWQPSVNPLNYKVSGAYAYILRNTAYDKVLGELSLMQYPTDDVFEKLYNHQIIKSYIFFPFIAYPNIESSYIWNKSDPGKIHPSIKYFKNNF